MKRILYLLSLTDEEGKLNFTHGIVIGAAANYIFNHSVESGYLVLGSFCLVAWGWKVNPSRSRKASLDEIAEVREKSQEALDQVKKLNLKLGFR